MVSMSRKHANELWQAMFGETVSESLLVPEHRLIWCGDFFGWVTEPSKPQNE